VYLPRSDVPVERAPHSPEERLSGGRETILLVEDEVAVRRVVQQVLARHGYRVLEAGNGVEALGVFAREGASIDLVLTDVVMPAMGGRELALRLRPQHPQLRVLMMSGYTDDGGVADEVSGARVSFLPKPVTAERLLRKVRDVLDGRT
jgi:DNA-binding NtrC family response regulator